MNNDIIKLLPDSVANQIAAGEVIQRPASVIKELVENSIDAQATSIQIIVKDAGRTLIQVIDNGKGMSPTDARMAFERHATSKINCADDLYTLHTMGFRGEALPSIAAVAQIDLRTMRHGDTIGSRLKINESRFESQEPCSCVPGSNFMVKNLFFHMPARRKFLKKDNVEMSHIMHEFERLALVNTNVEFTIISNDVTLHQLPASNLKQRIIALFGKNIGSQIIPVATETSIVKISGFIGLPQYAKRRGAPQYFFVNGRNMRHPYFHKAVLSCYDQLISPEVQPAYFINIDVEPSTIDVNIHPQKHEIKFENEQAIWQILTAAIKQSLGKVNAAGAIDFDSTDAPDIPIFLPDSTVGMPSISTDDKYNPFEQQAEPGYNYPPKAPSIQSAHYRVERRVSTPPDDWQKLYESFTKRRDDNIEDPDYVAPIDNRSDSNKEFNINDTPYVERRISIDEDLKFDSVVASDIPFGDKYILSINRDVIMVIDRRRAHIRILFDEYMKLLNFTYLPSQTMLFPESVTLSPSQSAILSTNTDTLERMGFQISFIGDNTWAINAAPAITNAPNPTEMLTIIISEIEEVGEVINDSLIEPIALAMARSAAVTKKNSLSTTEAENLVAKLFQTSNPNYTPDGLKIIGGLNSCDLDKLLN